MSTAAERNTAHLAAVTAWAAIERANPRFTGRSPVDGLAERIRAAKHPKPLNAAKRVAERKAFRARQIVALKTNTSPYQRPAQVGSYFPHQGPRECERRRRQIVAGQLNHANGLVQP